MGIQSPHCFTLTANVVNLEHLVAVKEHRFKNRQRAAVDSRIPRCIVIDANQIAFMYIGKSASPVKSVFEIALAIARTGTYVCIVCDSPIHDHAKHASIDREAGHERKRIRVIRARTELAYLLMTERCASTSYEVQKKIDSLKEIVKAFENGKAMPTSFSQDLRYRVNTFAQEYILPAVLGKSLVL
jgi:hypothetical protein